MSQELENQKKVWIRYQEYLKNRKPTVKIISKGSLFRKLFGEE
jgi:hypothetical protein